MHMQSSLLSLAAVIVVALIAGMIFTRLRQPALDVGEPGGDELHQEGGLQEGDVPFESGLGYADGAGQVRIAEQLPRAGGQQGQEPGQLRQPGDAGQIPYVPL